MRCRAFVVHQLKKMKWTGDEDERLRHAVEAEGTDSWNRIAAHVRTRTGKQCRERWLGQLAPSVSRETWSADEDAALLRARDILGNRWTTISAQLPGRSGLQVKNRWNWLLRHNAAADRPDVIVQKKPVMVAFDPIVCNDALFGDAFQEFRAKMFMDQ
jgi:hypothetical protein